MAFGEIEFRGDDYSPAFSELLAKLKQQGTNLLVTGEVSEAVSARASRTLLGEPNANRKRILALTDSTAKQVGPRLPVGVTLDSPYLWTIDQQNDERSVPRAAACADVQLPSPDGDRSDLQRLREEIVMAVGIFDAASGDLEPAELRLSVDSLTFLLDETDRASVERFLRSVVAIVRGVRGMGHYHLPVADDDPLVGEFTPLFDARIELRQRDGLVPEQRWHVPAYERETNWVRL